MRNQNQKSEDPIRAHTFDGIQEYDKRLPNWWLFTLYITIVFSIFYGLWYHEWDKMLSIDEQLKRDMDLALNQNKSQQDALDLSDAALWKMSRDTESIALGEKIYARMCVQCHGRELEGGVGESLVDSEWKHGGRPEEVMNTILDGVLDKGMPQWRPLLGKKKVAAVTAFILSHHQEPEVLEPTTDSSETQDAKVEESKRE